MAPPQRAMGRRAGHEAPNPRPPWAWCFPDPPRTIRHERAWNVAFRTGHLIAFGLLLGGHAWGVEPASLRATLWAVVASGVGLMALELYKTAHWLLLGKGIAVLLKLGLLLLVPIFWEARLPLLMAVTVIASVGSHMPARYRHYSLLEHRVLEPVALELDPKAPRHRG